MAESELMSKKKGSDKFTPSYKYTKDATLVVVQFKCTDIVLFNIYYSLLVSMYMSFGGGSNRTAASGSSAKIIV